MSFEVGHGNHHVGIGYRRPDFRCLAVFASDRDFHLFGAFQSVGDDYVAVCGNRIEPVFHRALEMVHGVGAPSGIECVGVGEERFRAGFAQHLRETGGEIGT